MNLKGTTWKFKSFNEMVSALRPELIASMKGQIEINADFLSEPMTFEVLSYVTMGNLKMIQFMRGESDTLIWLSESYMVFPPGYVTQLNKKSKTYGTDCEVSFTIKEISPSSTALDRVETLLLAVAILQSRPSPVPEGWEKVGSYNVESNTINFDYDKLGVFCALPTEGE